MRSAARAAIIRLSSLAAVGRLCAAATAHSLAVQVRVHPTSWLSPGVQFACEGPGSATLTIGPRTRIDSGALIRLADGSRIDIGPDVMIRTGAILNVAGHLELRGRNLVSWHSVIHCSEHVVFEDMAGTGEGVTVVDGSHYRLDRNDHWYRRSSNTPVFIRSNAWLASKCTVAKGVVVGAAATVAANSLVTENVPDEALVSGVPARIIRRGLPQAFSSDQTNDRS